MISILKNNTKILDLLLDLNKKLKENKFEMNLPDLDKKTPIDYAKE